jgi:hypothetical protein
MFNKKSSRPWFVYYQPLQVFNKENVAKNVLKI